MDGICVEAISRAAELDALELRILGSMQVLTSTGQPLTLPPSKKTRALLAYLAMTGRPVRRDRLCELFWDVPDDPRGALRWSLSRLRSVLDEPGAPRLLSAGDSIALDRGAVIVDLASVQTACAGGLDAVPTDELVRAATLFSGEVLADLDLPDCHTYQSWVVALREDARQLRSGILAALASRLAGTPDRALPYARDHVGMDPLNEQAWAKLVGLLAAAGRRREAEEQYETARGALAEVGGPSGALLKAWRELDGLRSAVPASRPPVPVPDRQAPTPSLAVLPFRNLGGDPDSDYFSYGLTEDIIRLLARHRWLSVLSRHSGAAHAGRELDAQELGRSLGVRYLVQGSVLRRGERVRLTADLICAETGRHLWSESYSLVLDDIIDVQEKMAQQLAAMVEPELARVERETAMRRPPRNLNAWDCYQRGLWHLWGFSKPGFAEAEAMFRQAIELEPEFARAHGALAYVKVQLSAVSSAAERVRLLREALPIARMALVLDDRDCMNHCVLGRAHCMLGEYAEAIAALQHSISLNPSFAQAYFALGHALVWVGREEEAIALLDRASSLSPRDPHLWSFHHARALAHFSLNDMEAAADSARQASRVPTASAGPGATLAASLALLGRAAEATTAAADLLTREPGYRQGRARETLHLAGDQFMARYLEGLARAGVPA